MILQEKLVRAFRCLLVIVFIQLAAVAAVRAAEVINNPDPATIYLLQCKFAGTTPAYEAMAQADSSVKAADEFHKAELAKQLVASLKARFASLEGVKEITVNFMSNFSEYDAQTGEYDFDISDGTYVPANAFGRELRIALTNGTLAQTWKLGPKEAEEALRKNKGERWARLALRLALLPSSPAVDREPIVLNTKIVGYDVLNRFSNVKLGSAVVENAH
jgi:hypothetical protein